MSFADDVVGGELRPTAIDASHLPARLPDETRERIQLLMTHVSRELHETVRFVGAAPGASHEGWILRLGDRTGTKVVVRLEPDEGPFLGYDGDREAVLLRWLRSQGFPVPQVLDVGARELVGSRFLVLEWIDGDVLNPRTASDMRPCERRERARAMVSMLARLHSAPLPPAAAKPVRWAATSDGLSRDGLDAIFKEFGQTLSRLRVVNSVVLDYVRIWLEQHRRERSGQRCLVHGDFRLGNLVWQGDDIVGILDWETAGVGDPLFDIAWMCMGATKGSDHIMGLVSREEFVQMYCDAAGRVIAPGELIFWQVVAAWVRGCTEARLLDISLVSHAPRERDARDLSWEFGSARTEQELFTLIDSYDGPE